MQIGFIGLGKLGLPVALSVENKGHTVFGYDINPEVKRYIEEKKIPYTEKGTPELLEKTKIEILELKEVVRRADILFVPIQTPHNALYEGITPLPSERVDFDYTYLVNGLQQITNAVNELQRNVIVVIISTVLPGTIEREIKPRLSKYIKLAYNPFFIAMGTTRDDFEDPKFVLLGCDDEDATLEVEKFYSTIHDRPVFKTTVKNAELIKVLYNTFISTKIAFINTAMEICHKTGCNVDAVTDALSLATTRIISTKYLRGGMGDGGGCHPRDNIALSWLAKKLDLSYDWFEKIMLQRQYQTEWLASLLDENKVCLILGKSFKKGTNLIVGSPALLLKYYYNEFGGPIEMYDPHIDTWTIDLNEYEQFFIATDHDEFKDYKFPKGSTVFDPWGIIKPQDGVNVVSIGRWGKYQ